MTTWYEFAWSAFLYGSMGGDPHYEGLFNKSAFMRSLRNSPDSLTDDEVRDHLILFLNQWKTRIDKSIAPDFRKAISNCHALCAAIHGIRLESADFEANVAVSGKSTSISDIVSQCYDAIHAVNGIGPTATAKTLHILVPEFLVMWDGYILDELAKTNPAIDSTGRGYVAFLKHAQMIARNVSDDFAVANPSPPRKPEQTIDSYLSEHLGYEPAKTLAKFIDEYFWATITNRAKVPPKWHPQK